MNPTTDRHAWTADQLKFVRDGYLMGKTIDAICIGLLEHYGCQLSYDAVQAKRKRLFGSTANFILEKSTEIRQFSTMNVPDGNYMLTCDYHAPFFSELWVNRLLGIARKFHIKKNIIIGDFFDFDFATPWLPGADQRKFKEEMSHVQPLINAMTYFDKNYLVVGNHERRIGLLTAGRIRAEHMFGAIGGRIWNDKMEVTALDKLEIGDKWLAVHPKSYSMISTTIPRRLAEKYGRHIISTHGHFCGMAFDKSGKLLCVDLGGLFDATKVAYINEVTTIHPFWNNGFGMLRNGKFWLFSDMTDWDYFL
jgi:hypothetical protein